MHTDGVDLDFPEDCIRRLAEIAFDVNETTENIGARRLYTVMEKLLEDLSFSATAAQAGTTVKIDTAYVNEKLDQTAADQDLARYVL